MKTLLTVLLFLLFICTVQAQDMGTVVAQCGNTPLAYTVGSTRPIQVDQFGNLCSAGNSLANGSGNAGYVSNAVPVTRSGTGTTGAVTATLPGTPGLFTYICGFSISTLEGATPLATAPTVTGTQVTLTWQIQNTASVATQFTQTFSPCLPSSTNNTAIVVTSPANANATAVDVNAWGFQQ